MDKGLFNPKTIQRLSSKIKLSHIQKKSAREWLYFLDEGKLKKEKLNYPKFMIIVLQNLLGYDIKDMAHEEGNIEFPFKNKEGKTVLGIEAKGTSTKDLFAEQSGYRDSQKTPIDQLWNYMGKLDLDYGVATNYKDFVLLDRSKGSSSYHFLNFEDVKNNEQKLKEFIAIFSKGQIIDNGFIEKLEEESAIEEKNFTKEFYKLFHETRLMLIKEFQDNGVSKEESIHFAQLFLNRLLFVFFAEDTDKLEKRLFEDMITSGLKSEMLISDQSKVISDTILSLFLRLDKGSLTPRKIFGFNGGLFEESIPPRIYFKDLRDGRFFNDILQYSKLKKESELNGTSKSLFNKYQNKLTPIIKNLLIMASFDFKTEVSVNILGHIFEQSLTDLEDLKEGKSTKRKKEGIFYTPEYITDYICRNTIIPYLSKKDIQTPRELVLEYSGNINELYDRLINLRILDPACGSGAFLIKAVDVLLEIHKELQLFKQFKREYTAIKKGRKFKKDEGQLTLIKWHEEDEARAVIEKNIFGVDINEESVEITKLSLFFKISKKNKKLIDLSKNIKCGNSLIHDKAVDLNAFDWNNEEKGFGKMIKEGFDIVIGNPPYVFTRGNEYFNNIKHYIWNTYPHNKGKINLYSVFLELSINKLLRLNGYLGFITPETFIRTSTYSEIRRFIGNNFDIKKINIYGIGVFDNVTAETMTLIINKNYSKDNLVLFNKIGKNNLETFKVKQIDFKNMPENRFIYATTIKDKRLFDLIKENSIKLGDIVEVRNGIATKADKKKFISKNKFNDKYKKLLEAPEIHRYGFEWKGNYINYNRKLLHRPRKEETFLSNKIMIQRVSSRLICAYDEDRYYTFNSIDNLVLINTKFSLKYIICLLNSKLMDYYYRKNFSLDASYTITVTKQNLDVLPIKNITLAYQEPFIKKADLILRLNKELHDKKEKFLKLLKHEYKLEHISKKLIQFHELDFDTFIKQLGDRELSINKKSELMEFFDESKKNILELKEQISIIDKEIDKMVYNLYKITEKETIEKSLE